MSVNGGDPTSPPLRPPPMIGKIGPYTVFVTPPQTPKPSSSHSHHQQSPLPSDSPPKKKDYPVIQPPAQSLPPVLPPPVHYNPKSDASSCAFFWNAVAKVQNAHSSLDGYVAHWFGLNRSKYQWALDDYYETKGMDQVDAKAKNMSTKAESV